ASRRHVEIGECCPLGRRPLFVLRWAMNIEVKFDGVEIIVTKPGTDFMLAYRRRPDQPNLVLTRSWIDPEPPSPAEATRNENPRSTRQRGSATSSCTVQPDGSRGQRA